MDGMNRLGSRSGEVIDLGRFENSMHCAFGCIFTADSTREFKSVPAPRFTDSFSFH